MHSHCLQLPSVAETKGKETAAENEDDDGDDGEVRIGRHGRHAQLPPAGIGAFFKLGVSAV